MYLHDDDDAYRQREGERGRLQAPRFSHSYSSVVVASPYSQADFDVERDWDTAAGARSRL